MILPCIDQGNEFPDADQALQEPDGLLCFGGELTTSRLINAYSRGIFPWYSEGEPVLWWCPSERMVLYPNNLHISKSLSKAIKKHQPKYFFNRNFKTVINHCANVPRADNGTWIHPEMIVAYDALFKEGHAFCIEVEINGQLVGGMYGVALKNVFCGESMFSLQTNGSKFAMHGLCQIMNQNDIQVLDCQLHNPHLAAMGAELISRNTFLNYLA